MKPKLTQAIALLLTLALLVTTPTFATEPHDIFTYDALGRLVQIQSACGTFTTFIYDVNGNILYVRVTSYMLGDANGDGRVTSADAVLLARHLRGEDVEINLHVMDLNGDGVVDLYDLLLLQRWLVGLEVPPVLRD